MTPFHFEKTGAGWLADVLPELRDLPSPPETARIESRAQASNSLGPRPLWSGYRSLTNYPTDTKGTRSSNDVRSAPTMGRFFAWIAAERKPDVIVEFGTAFGVSGMYWLAGLNAAATGTLFTFEPNADWASIADANLSAISHRYRLTVGTFEDHVASTLDGRGIDIAFVDAIHTDGFVTAQYAVLKRYLRKGALVLFDDIGFSEEMRSCWARIAVGPEVIASARLEHRLGILEFQGG